MTCDHIALVKQGIICGGYAEIGVLFLLSVFLKESRTVYACIERLSAVCKIFTVEFLVFFSFFGTAKYKKSTIPKGERAKKEAE